MVSHRVSDLLADHVTLEVEGIDRLYLNLYQPRLQTPGGVVQFFKHERGNPVVSSALMAPMSRSLVKAIETFAKQEGIDVVRFEKGKRKDDVTQQRLAEEARNAFAAQVTHELRAPLTNIRLYGETLKRLCA